MSHVKRIIILGSTGSIGRQTLDVISAMPERMRVVGLAANSNAELLLQQARQFNVKDVALLDTHAQKQDSRYLTAEIVNDGRRLLWGPEGLEQLVRECECDMVVSALVGAAGLRPTLAAICAGIDVALANKETLVAAGRLVMRAVRDHNVRLLPVDSEHSALFQCLVGEKAEAVKRIILTASGGPFRNATMQELRTVTAEQALSHPTWSMGSKITIDSATLMNKGLEIIEAHHLFGMEIEKIEVMLHPQSIVHSLVEFVDGSVKAQLGMPDMRLPILYALCYPERVANPRIPRLNLLEHSPLTFHPPDEERFPCLRLAKEALRQGGTMPAVMNAANEVAVRKFLTGEVAFTDIPTLIAETMRRHTMPEGEPTLEDILRADTWARACVEEIA